MATTRFVLSRHSRARRECPSGISSSAQRCDKAPPSRKQSFLWDGRLMDEHVYVRIIAELPNDIEHFECSQITSKFR